MTAAPPTHRPTPVLLLLIHDDFSSTTTGSGLLWGPGQRSGERNFVPARPRRDEVANDQLAHVQRSPWRSAAHLPHSGKRGPGRTV